MKNIMPSPATIVLIGSSLAVFCSLVAALGVYLGSLQDAKKSQHLLSSVTGGNSHPLILAQLDGSFFICVKGDYPLHEVHGQIFDVQELRKTQAKNFNPLSPVPRAQYFELGTLSSAYGMKLINKITKQPVLLRQFKQRKSYRFMVHLFSRHHTFNFRLALEPSPNNDGSWLQAWQVYRDSTTNSMDQSIPNEFPRDSDGEVDFLLLPKNKTAQY
jgi:hypothetical protein